MKASRKIVARRKAVRRSPPLSLSARIERLEKVVLFPKPAAAPKVPATRFVRLCANGSAWLDAQDGDWVAVHDAKTGLIWSAEPLQKGKSFNHAAAMQACKDLDLLGKKDWRAPTIEEQLSIIDYTRCDPAVDTEFFKGPFGWTWSSTIAKAPSGYPWDVNLDGGGSGRDFQAGDGHVRAVRAGQQIGLLA